MSNDGFVRGWKAVRAHRSEFLDPRRVRRRTVVGGVVATGVGAFLVVADRLWGLFDGGLLRDVVAVVLLAAGAGCVVAAFLGVGRRSGRSARQPLGDWRRDDRITRQFAAHPPAMMTEDRDEVTARAELSIETAVVATARSVWIPIGWLLAWVAFLVSGLATADRLTLWLIPPVFAALQSGTFVATVVAAGRADAARDRAAQLPSASPPPAPPQRNRDPRGSKLGLPED
ncbi:hypothetical protein ACRQ4C_13270 [Curtobacterium sp. SP.BCp]|uniref:hypothetical protein n=1 Tax=Curtobacterium sp. SP.BCp TaxID=3435230 RepID=UPI003F7389FC